MTESPKPVPTTAVRRAIARLPDEVVSFGHLAASSMLNQVVRFFTGILNARLLTPGLYAINSLSGVIVRYVSYGHLGVQNGVNRQVPIELGCGAADEADAYAGTAFWVVLGVSALTLVSAGTLWFAPQWSVIPREYYFDIAALGVASLFYQYFCAWLVSTARFALLASMRARYDLPAVVLTTVAVYFFRLHGLLLVQAVAMLLQAVVIVHKTGFRPKGFSIHRVRYLFVSGWPILASSLLIYVFMTIDLLFVTGRYSQVEIGLYGFALNAAFFYRTYAQSMADVLQPKMGRVFGAASEDPRALSRFTLEYTLGLAPVFGMIGAVFFVGIPIVIQLFLPSYSGSIEPFRYLLLAELALSIYIPSGHAMTLMRKQAALAVWMILGCVVASGAFLLLLSPTAALGEVSLLWLAVSTVVSFGIVVMGAFFTAPRAAFPYGQTARNLGVSSAVLAVVASVGGWSIATLPLLSVLEGLIRLFFIEVLLLMILLLVDSGNPISSKVRTALSWREKAG